MKNNNIITKIYEHTERTTPHIQDGFGLGDIKENTPIFWGARTIFNLNKPNPIDILGDRCTFKRKEHVTDSMKNNFTDWIDKYALPTLREYKYALDSLEQGELYFYSDNGKYKCVASTRKSSGYLYIGCKELTSEEIETEYKPLQKGENNG